MSNRIAMAEYVADHASELSSMADNGGLSFLAFLLAMAALEAQQQAVDDLSVPLWQQPVNP